MLTWHWEKVSVQIGDNILITRFEEYRGAASGALTCFGEHFTPQEFALASVRPFVA